MADWFNQWESTEEKTSKPKPVINKRSTVQKTFDVTCRNSTLYPWRVQVNSAVISGDNVQAHPVRVDTEANGSFSKRIKPTLMMSQTLRVNDVVATATLNDNEFLCTEISVRLKETTEMPFRSCSQHTNILVEIGWDRSATLVGHMVPTMRMETAASDRRPDA